MFNHHFFEREEGKRFGEFLMGAHNLLIVVDPPYGGLLQALQITLEKIKTVSCKGMHVFSKNKSVFEACEYSCMNSQHLGFGFLS